MEKRKHVKVTQERGECGTERRIGMEKREGRLRMKRGKRLNK